MNRRRRMAYYALLVSLTGFIGSFSVLAFLYECQTTRIMKLVKQISADLENCVNNVLVHNILFLSLMMMFICAFYILL